MLTLYCIRSTGDTAEPHVYFILASVMVKITAEGEDSIDFETPSREITLQLPEDTAVISFELNHDKTYFFL